MSFYDINNSNVVDNVEQINDFLYYNKDFKIVICFKCHDVLNNDKNDNFDAHFKSNIQHRNLTFNEKKEINNTLKTYSFVSIKDVKISKNFKHFFSYLYTYN